MKRDHRKASPESLRAMRKKASESLRSAVRELTACGDHGTAFKVKAILDHLDQRRRADNETAGLQ